jgi:endonuclease I
MFFFVFGKIPNHTTMKRFLPILLFILTLNCFAQVPAGYYDNAEGLTGNQLKTALHNIIKNHKTYQYTADTTDVWDILKESDRDPGNAANVIFIYTGWSVNAAQEYNNGVGWSREHVWASSHGEFNETPPAGTDCHHIRPEDISVNSARGNKDFDNGGTQHAEATNCYTDADSWEPRPAVKGDVARMMFYMATRYEGNVSGEPDLELVNYTGTSGPVFGKLSTLLSWHEQDPVDDFERNRNEVVFSYQHNRNPFIDHPEWVSEIWTDNYNNPPIISVIIRNPSSPTSNQTVSVSASINDYDGTISSATLKWGLSSGSLTNSINMSVTSGSTYVTNSSIPAQTAGTNVYFRIISIDNDNDTAYSVQQTYLVYVAPNVAPTITDVQYSPANPGANDSVLVSATITDSDGTISSAVLKWKRGTESTIYEKQMVLSDSKYKAYIPAQNAGQTIYFIIVAKDNRDAEVSYMDGSYIVSSASSTDLSLNNITITIYPNPAKNDLIIETNNDLPKKFDILTIYGQTVISSVVENRTVISISDLPNGVYFVKLFSGEKMITRKFVKQ